MVNGRMAVRAIVSIPVCGLNPELINYKKAKIIRSELLDCILNLENGPAEAFATEQLEVRLLLFTHLRIHVDPAMIDIAGSYQAEQSHRHPNYAEC
jgi:hypothetical protein